MFYNVNNNINNNFSVSHSTCVLENLRVCYSAVYNECKLLRFGSNQLPSSVSYTNMMFTNLSCFKKGKYSQFMYWSALCNRTDNFLI